MPTTRRSIVLRAEAASCLPTPEQEAIAAKIVERCAEYDRGVRCAPRKFQLKFYLKF